MGNLESIRQGGVQAEIDIVEDSGHSKLPELKNLPLSLAVWYSQVRVQGHPRCPPTAISKVALQRTQGKGRNAGILRAFRLQFE